MENEIKKYVPRIDDEASFIIPLNRKTDNDGYPFYTGKCQFPGMLDFEMGISFRAYVSEERGEELEVGMLSQEDRLRLQNKQRSGAKFDDRMQISIKPEHDSSGKLVFVGGAICPVQLSMNRGVWITLFVKEGREELQISRLHIPPPQARGSENRLKAQNDY